MSNQKFFVCKHCGNFAGLLHDSGLPMSCCGEKMQELVPNTTEAATEKHLPEVRISGSTVNVKVGSVAHPMTEEHHIAFIYLQTADGGQRKCLKVGEAPEATFELGNDRALEVFEYCNLHGLWKVDVRDCKSDDTVCSAEFTKGCI